MLDLPRAVAPSPQTLRNRVSELRNDGHNIEATRCRRHEHRGPVYAYRLVLPAEQQAMRL